MSALNNKIDFALVFTVRNANPNGDPVNGGGPRITYTGFGEVSDVCLKRKIRNRWMDEGLSVFVQSDDRRTDSCRSLKERAESCPELKELFKVKKGKNDKDDEDDGQTKSEKITAIACEKWLDVRAFGQVFPFSGEIGKSDGVSIGIRGPVSIQSAFSLTPVNITELNITKSVNLETDKNNPDKKGSDTMGSKRRVDFGVYTTYGSINVQIAEKTGFSADDAEALKEALRTLFRNDVAAARPEGSMEVCKLVWWEHNCKSGQFSAAKVHRSMKVTVGDDGFPQVGIDESAIPGLKYTVIDGE